MCCHDDDCSELLEQPFSGPRQRRHVAILIEEMTEIDDQGIAHIFLVSDSQILTADLLVCPRLRLWFLNAIAHA